MERPTLIKMFLPLSQQLFVLSLYPDNVKIEKNQQVG